VGGIWQCLVGMGGWVAGGVGNCNWWGTGDRMGLRVAAGRAAGWSRRALVSPVAKAGVASCVINCASDANCQLLVRWVGKRADEGRFPGRSASYWSGLAELDLERCARFAVVGLTLHGPYFTFAFALLERWLGPARTVGAVLKKSAAGNLTVFPVYLAAFYLYMGLLEGKRGHELLQKYSAFVPSYTMGWAFWLPVNMLNFAVVPPGFGRVLYINAMGLLWNTYLSYINSSVGAGRNAVAAVAEKQSNL